MIDQNRVDHAADLNELLPLTAVACKARYLACSHCSDPAQADFGHHALETAANLGAGGRSAQVLVDDLDVGETKITQPTLHRILQLLALQVVRDLERGRLPHVEHSLAC